MGELFCKLCVTRARATSTYDQRPAKPQHMLQFQARVCQNTSEQNNNKYILRKNLEKVICHDSFNSFKKNFYSMIKPRFMTCISKIYLKTDEKKNLSATLFAKKNGLSSFGDVERDSPPKSYNKRGPKCAPNGKTYTYTRLLKLFFSQ